MELVPVLKDLIDAKNAYSDILDKNIMNEITDKDRDDLLTTLDLTEWISDIPHTVILLDDAINVLKENKYKDVRDLLFQNRQPRLTVFICVQDIYRLPVQLRRNCDSLFIFAGMTDRMVFGMMVSQLGINGLINWETYCRIHIGAFFLLIIFYRGFN
jgi:hypothetical protein